MAIFQTVLLASSNARMYAALSQKKPLSTNGQFISGTKGRLCLEYKTIITLAGRTADLHINFERKMHDLALLRQNRWEEIMSDPFQIDGRQYYVYGDSFASPDREFKELSRKHLTKIANWHLT